jgi:hypothetical protein
MRARVACAVLCLCTFGGTGRPASAQQLKPGTTVVELLGLRKWTRQMVEDSVARYQPGVTLADHSCAVILRDSVGFADAAAITVHTPTDTTWVVLPLVEPEQKALVRFRVYSMKRKPIPEWSAIETIAKANPRALQPLQNPQVLLDSADTFAGRPLEADTRALRQAVRAHATVRDWALARATILEDSSVENRTAAALVLSNFAARDSAFYLLAEGLRAKDGGAQAAQMVLSALSRGDPRKVDWAPAKDALRALVGGTNLFAYTLVLRALVATQVDPALGLELARVNPGLLLDAVGAKNPFTVWPAHSFLVHIRGQDLGHAPEAWKAWITG